MYRSRKVAKMANSCGKEPEGKDREEKFCNIDTLCEAPKDCLFAPWSAWSECSASCNGVKRRSRTIGENGQGAGAFCDGALKETWPCNPDEGEEPSSKCLPAPDIDCAFGDWEPWSGCSATCGGGQHMRSRAIAKHAQHYGKACADALSEVHECARLSCGGPQAVDCAFGDWEDWQECGKCDGQRKRVRHITAHAAHGGISCDAFTSHELGKCPRACNAAKYCGWTSWASWSQCSTSCGVGGTRQRVRQMNLTDAPPQDFWEALPEQAERRSVDVSKVLQQYTLLSQEMQDLNVHHIQELSIAFAVGCLTLLLAMAALRYTQVISDGRSGQSRSTVRGVSSRP